MSAYKLILDDYIEDDFSLIAIHCSEEAYKVAYLLNQFTGLRLCRKKVDLEFNNKGLEVTFPLYEFEDEFNYTTYNLVSNKRKTQSAKVASSGGLFGALADEETITTVLIPEYRQVDYFLKIYSDFKKGSIRNLTTNINNIKQIISAFEIDIDQLKSRNNLIFY